MVFPSTSGNGTWKLRAGGGALRWVTWKYGSIAAAVVFHFSSCFTRKLDFFQDLIRKESQSTRAANPIPTFKEFFSRILQIRSPGAPRISWDVFASISNLFWQPYKSSLPWDSTPSPGFIVDGWWWWDRMGETTCSLPLRVFPNSWDLEPTSLAFLPFRCRVSVSPSYIFVEISQCGAWTEI